ncbi:MAG: ABC transporter ATP-binding protein/permease [Acholeplasmatales bacterium]|nr:ABC transporter ATP-binding protein/permease [Acholeplasmatales bacterium]
MQRRPMNHTKQPVKKGAYKKLVKSLKPYTLPIVISMIFIITGVILSIIAPQYLKDLTNEIANNAASRTIDMDKVWDLAIILIIFYVANALLSFISGIIMTQVTQKYGYNLRKNISDKINRMPLKYFDTHPFGDTLSRVTNDVDQITQSLQQSITMLLQSVVMIVGVLIAMFISNWVMALTVLISVPLAILQMMFMTKLAIPHFKKRQAYTGEVNAIVEENFTGSIVIKLFNAEKRREKGFNESNEKLHLAMIKAQIFGGMMMPIMSFISYFAYAAVCVVGGLLMAYDKGISFGMISAFLVYVNLFQSPLSQLGQAMNTVQMAAASSSRVFELLDEEEEINEDDKPYALLKDGYEVKGKVEFKNVRFGYNEDKIIIPNFSATVEPGMKVAIVGPTGAGKTTLVNLLMRFYEINDGDILIDGVSIHDMTRKEIRNIFGMVLQDSWIFEGTIRDNVVYSKEGVTDEVLNKALENASLLHYVNTLEKGVDTHITGENALSQGQRQLMTIARAFVENAPLTILDEATSNVDTRTEIQIQNAMDNLTKGRTSFVIAHRLSTIKNADLILVLKDGNIIEHGNHDELMALGGFYESLYNSQFDEEAE